MNNLCQLALKNGGSVNYLILPSNITEGLGLTNPSKRIYFNNWYSYFTNPTNKLNY